MADSTTTSPPVRSLSTEPVEIGFRPQQSEPHHLAVTRIRYEPIAVSSGTFGTVYRATLNDAQVVAMKRVECSVDDNDDIRMRYECEIFASLRNACAHIVGLIHVEIGSPIPTMRMYQLYMEYGGQRLHDVMPRDPGSGDPSLVWAVAVGITSALEFLHRPGAIVPTPGLCALDGDFAHRVAHHGLVHGDVGPQNIVVVRTSPQTWHARLIDFHVSMPADGRSPMALMTTETCRSPEVLIQIGTIAAGQDMWALGAVLGELLTGCPIFWPSTEVFADSLPHANHLIHVPANPADPRYEMLRVQHEQLWLSIAVMTEIVLKMPVESPLHPGVQVKMPLATEVGTTASCDTGRFRRMMQMSEVIAASIAVHFPAISDTWSEFAVVLSVMDDCLQFRLDRRISAKAALDRLRSNRIV